MKKEEIVNKYIKKFRAIPCGKYHKEFLEEDDSYHDLGTSEGLIYCWGEVERGMSGSENKLDLVGELTCLWLDLYLRGNVRGIFELDFRLGLYHASSH